MSSFWAATSTASEIAIPSEPVGCCALRAAGLGRVRGRAVDGRPPGLHHRAAVGLLVVARADHPHLALEPEQLAGERQRRSPLAGAGLGRELLDPGLGVLVRLGDGGVRLVRARRPRRPRTCSRCAPGCRARARAGGRGTAASGATACMPRGPARESRSRARPRPPGGSAPSGRSASGRRDRRAAWSRGGAAGAAVAGSAMSAIRLTQCVGIAGSSSTNLTRVSLIASPFARCRCDRAQG